MKTKISKGALAFAGLKAGQQILHDLDSAIMNNSTLDVARYGTEQICRISSAGAAAYTIDEAVKYVEEFFPKPIRGLLPFAAATIGVGALINYFGNYFNVQDGLGVWETTGQLIKNYQNSLADLVTFNPVVNAGHLIGAGIALKSGARFCKNLGQTIMKHAERKRVQNNIENK